MERSFGLKFLLNQDPQIKNRKPIFERLEGLRNIKPNQKLILRVQRPKSIMIGDFRDEFVISVPRSLSPNRNRYINKISYNNSSVDNRIMNSAVKSSRHEEDFRLQLTPNRVHTDLVHTFNRVNEEDNYGINLNIKGKSAHFTFKKSKEKEIKIIHQAPFYQLGNLPKVTISKKARQIKSTITK